MPSPVTASTHEEPSTWIDHLERSSEKGHICPKMQLLGFRLTHLRDHPPMVAWDDLELHSSPSLAFPGFCRIPQPNVVVRGAGKKCPLVLCGGMGIYIDRGKRGPIVYQLAPPFAPSPGVRHLPSNMTPVRKRNYTAHDSRAGGIPEGLEKTWNLRGTSPSELPYVPHVDSTVSSSGVDLAPVWGPTCLRNES